MTPILLILGLGVAAWGLLVWGLLRGAHALTHDDRSVRKL